MSSPPFPEGVDGIEIIEMTTFGDILRRTRTQRGLSQKELGNILGASQSKISAWERGVQLPRKTAFRHSLDETAQLLTVSKADLIDALSNGESGRGKVLTGENYLQKVAGLIGLNSRDSKNLYTFWFIGPRMLPVVDSPPFRQLWKSALLAGHSFTLILFLDLMTSSEYRQLIAGLFALQCSMESLQKKVKGRILVLTTSVLYPSSQSLESARDSGSDVEASRMIELLGLHRSIRSEINQAKNRVLTVEPIKFISNSSMRCDLLRMWNSDGPILLAEPHSSTGQLFSTVGLQSVTCAPGEDSENLWSFHNRQRSFGLYEVITKFKGIRSDHVVLESSSDITQHKSERKS